MRLAARTWSVLTLLTLLLAACTGPSQNTTGQPAGATQAPAAREGGTLRVASGGLPKVFHPYPEAQIYTTSHSDAWNLMGAGLISLDYNTLDFSVDPRTDMATELPRITNDGKTFTFTLRDGLKWSDGRPITVDDFTFGFENGSKEENDCICLDDIQHIVSFRTPDARTIEVTLDQKYARFLAYSFASGVSPVPKHVWEGKPWLDPGGNPELLKPTVVAGPYVPKEIGAEQHAYVRNTNWWGKKPVFDEIDLINTSPQTMVDSLRTRRVDWIEGLTNNQYRDAKALSNANVVEWTGATGSYRVVNFNLQRPVLSDKRVREALVRSINRLDLVQFEDGLAEPQYGLYPQNNTKWANNNVEKYDFDLSKARQLLQDAGYRLDGQTLRNASGQPVSLEILWPTSSPPRGREAQYLQQQWKQLGIDATVTALEFNAFVDREQRQKDFDVSMGSWAATLDADGVREQVRTKGAQNTPGYSNPRVDELLNAGQIEQDDAKRKQIYDEVQQIVVNDIPSFSTLTLRTFSVFDKNVQGVSPTKGGDIFRENNSQYLDWALAQ